MSSITYQRLGHFTLNDNTANNYKSRELKSVFLDHYWKYLKISLDKPFFNKFNPFNQVGLVRIVCHGSAVTDYFPLQMSMANISESMPQGQDIGSNDEQFSPNQQVDGINEDLLDPMIIDKLELLNKKKNKLVEMEDFDRAKDIKALVDKIKVIGAQITKMEYQKRQSIAAEDYDTSKMLKFEIERMRDAALSFDTDRLLTPLDRSKPASSYRRIPGEIIETEAELIEQSIKELQDLEEEVDDDEDDYDYGQKQEYLEKITKYSERPIKPAAPDLYSGNYDFEKIEEKRREDEKRRKEKILIQKSAREESKYEEDQEDDGLMFSDDKADIPVEQRKAGNIGQAIDYGNVNDENKEEFLKDQEEKLKELDDVPNSKREFADSLSQIFDEDIIKHLFSTKWQQRVKGYDMANGYTLSILQGTDDIASTQKLIFALIQEGLEDKIVQVQQNAMSICSTYLSANVSSGVKPINETTEFENIIVLVFDKLAISKIDNTAKDLIVQMIESSLINLETFLDFMFKPESFYLEGKGRKSFAHLIPRFQIIKDTIWNLNQLQKSGRISVDRFPLKNLQDRLNDATKSNNKELRKITKEIVIDMYKVFGYKKVEEFIQNLDPKFVQQVADSNQTPEIAKYLLIAANE